MYPRDTDKLFLKWVNGKMPYLVDINYAVAKKSIYL